MQDPYGNYALQEIMNKWPEQAFIPLARKEKGLVCSNNKIAQLSIQKFSSNVVEKWIKMGTPVQRNEIILQISKIEKLVNLMQNSFGNYVVQTALELSEGETKKKLARSIYDNIPSIQDRKIRIKWAQLLYGSIHDDSLLSQTLDLSAYLQESAQPGVQAPKVEMVQQNVQMVPPNYDYPPDDSRINFGGKNIPISVEPSNQYISEEPQNIINNPSVGFSNFDTSSQLQQDFNTFGGFGAPPQFDDEDSDE